MRFRTLATLVTLGLVVLVHGQGTSQESNDFAGLLVLRSMTILQWAIVVAIAAALGISAGWLSFRNKVQVSTPSHASRIGMVWGALVFLLVNIVAPPLMHLDLFRSQGGKTAPDASASAEKPPAGAPDKTPSTAAPSKDEDF